MRRVHVSSAFVASAVVVASFAVATFALAAPVSAAPTSAPSTSAPSTSADSKAAAPTSAAPDCVVLLHGLARTSRSMNRLATALESEGYAVANVDYPSRELPIEELAPIAIDRGLTTCRRTNPARIHFVTHSLGGILVRVHLSRSAIPELSRVVMLGPPNQGSEVVNRFSGMPGYALLNGPAGFELGTGPESVPSRLPAVTYPVGVIAGTASINPILSTAFPGENDGKVSVARASVEGMADFLTLPISHPFLMRDREAIRQTLWFLREGRFQHDDRGPADPIAVPVYPVRPRPRVPASDPLSDVEEMIVEVTPHYIYPDDPYQTPSGPDRVFRGRWMADFEGGIFMDAATGDPYSTTRVDDEIWEYVQIGKDYYDWNACFDLTLVGAVAYPPSTDMFSGDWLIVRRVVEISACPCQDRDGLRCNSWLETSEEE